MEEILKLLNNNPWLNLLFLVLAILGILTSVLLYFWGKREKAPVSNKRGFNLIKDQLNKIEAIKITYNGQEVKNLTLTKIAIWNRGRQTINKEDIAPSDLVRLEISPQYKILQINIAFAKTPANNFSVRLNVEGNIALIDFDYFDTNDGIVLDVYHTGLSSDDIKLEGTIKGVGKIKPGIIEEDALIDVFLRHTLFHIFPPKKKRGKLLNVLLVVSIILLLPVFFLLSGIEALLRAFRRVPKEFSLQEKDDRA